MRYWRVHPRFWTDEHVLQWSDDVRLLALYLLTNPHRTTVSGLYRLPKPYMEADLRWSPQRLETAFTQLLEDGFAAYDEAAGVVLIAHALRYQRPENPNALGAEVDAIADLPRTPLIARLFQLASQIYPTLAKRLQERLGEQLGEPLSQPLGEQLGEQSEERLAEPSSEPLAERLGEYTAPAPALTPATATARVGPPGQRAQRDEAAAKGHAQEGPEQVTNRALIAELVRAYRAVVPQEAHKRGDYAFIGRLYNTHGYDRVLSAIQALRRRVEDQDIEQPLLYLQGILRREEEDPGAAQPSRNGTSARTLALDEPRYRKFIPARAIGPEAAHGYLIWPIAKDGHEKTWEEMVEEARAMARAEAEREAEEQARWEAERAQEEARAHAADGEG